MEIQNPANKHRAFIEENVFSILLLALILILISVITITTSYKLNHPSVKIDYIKSTDSVTWIESNQILLTTILSVFQNNKNGLYKDWYLSIAGKKYNDGKQRYWLIMNTRYMICQPNAFWKKENNFIICATDTTYYENHRIKTIENEAYIPSVNTNLHIVTTNSDTIALKAEEQRISIIQHQYRDHIITRFYYPVTKEELERLTHISVEKAFIPTLPIDGICGKNETPLKRHHLKRLYKMLQKVEETMQQY